MNQIQLLKPFLKYLNFLVSRIQVQIDNNKKKSEIKKEKEKKRLFIIVKHVKNAYIYIYEKTFLCKVWGYILKATKEQFGIQK